VFKHFLLTYYRNAVANKLQTGINYIGLSISVALIVLILLYVNSELTFDRFHTKADYIYRMTTKIITPGGENNLAFSNTAFAYILKKECPEIENIACIDVGGVYHVKYENRVFRESNVRLSTSGIFDLFSYQFLKGNPETQLREPYTTVLTEALAKKLFDNLDPIGKIIAFEDKNYTVTGVIKDLPSNTDLKITALLASPVNGTEELIDWEDYFVYLLVNKNANSSLQKKINEITNKTYEPLLTGDYKGISIRYNLQPLKQTHFDTSYLGDNPKGNKVNVYAFSIIALLILLIACINYINLNIARAVTRNKEMSIRKITGSGKWHLITQLLGESVITTILSLVIALFIVMLLFPAFNYLTYKDFNYYALAHPSIVLALVIIIFLIGFISGIYPAVYQFKLLKAKNAPKNKGFSSLSRALVIFQFVISIALICIILIFNKQLRFMKNTPLGFDQNQIIAINLGFKNVNSSNLFHLKQELMSNPKVDKIATGGGGTQLGSTGEWIKSLYSTKTANGQDVQFVLNMPEIDDKYLKLFDIKLSLGRNFSKEFPADYKESAIVNSAYVKAMGWKQPIGQTIFEKTNLRIIGVVNDFHFASLHNKIEPLAFRFNDTTAANLFIKLVPADINIVQAIWTKNLKDVPFEYQFVDKNFEKQYIQEEKQQSIIRSLSIVALLISCLGLYGLSSFFIARRTKEIGTRKVNGARIAEVMTMLNKDFIKWVTIAFVIACPIAYYAMHKWLQNFAYKTELSWWMFALAGLTAVAVALLTVSCQSYKAATKKPVKSLRYE